MKPTNSKRITLDFSEKDFDKVTADIEKLIKDHKVRVTIQDIYIVLEDDLEQPIKEEKKPLGIGQQFKFIKIKKEKVEKESTANVGDTKILSPSQSPRSPKVNNCYNTECGFSIVNQCTHEEGQCSEIKKKR